MLYILLICFVNAYSTDKVTFIARYNSQDHHKLLLDGNLVITIFGAAGWMLGATRHSGIGKNVQTVTSLRKWRKKSSSSKVKTDLGHCP